MSDNSHARASSGQRAPVFVAEFCDPSRRHLVLIAAVLASAMGFIDSSVVAIALPSMRESMGASLPQAQWFANAYMLTLSAFVLVGGAFGDRFGLARVFGGGIALFVAASIACALAWSPETLIAARTVQGVGAAMMVPGSLAVVSRAYPREERGRAIGTWAAASSVSTAAGPIVGGLALTFGGPEMWRWIFAINLPFGLLALWLLYRAIRQDEGRPGEPIDVLGAGLAVLGLGLLALGLTGAEHGTGPNWPVFGIGLLVLFVFVGWERRVLAPMLDLALFRDRVFAVVNLATLIHWIGFTGLIFYLPVTLVGAWGIDEITASLALAPLSVFIGLLSRRTGGLVEKYGARWVLCFGMAVVGASFAWLAMVLDGLDFWRGVLPAMILMGFGMAFVAAPLSTVVMLAVDEVQSGTASGINNAVARTAGLISVAALGSVAAARFGASGGLGSFAAATEPASEVAASTTGMISIAWIAAGCAAVSSVLCCIGLQGPAKYLDLSIRQGPHR